MKTYKGSKDKKVFQNIITDDGGKVDVYEDFIKKLGKIAKRSRDSGHPFPILVFLQCCRSRRGKCAFIALTVVSFIDSFM